MDWRPRESLSPLCSPDHLHLCIICSRRLHEGFRRHLPLTEASLHSLFHPGGVTVLFIPAACYHSHHLPPASSHLRTGSFNERVGGWGWGGGCAMAEGQRAPAAVLSHHPTLVTACLVWLFCCVWLFVYLCCVPLCSTPPACV